MLPGSLHPAAEHRLYPRIRVSQLEVSYRPYGLLQALLPSLRPARKAWVHDLSEGGMRLIAQAPSAPASLLTLEPRASFIPDRMSLQGRVVRCQKSRGEAKGPGRRYEWGIAFDGAGEGYRALVRRLRRNPLLLTGILPGGGATLPAPAPPAEDDNEEAQETSVPGCRVLTRGLAGGIVLVEVEGCLDAHTSPHLHEAFEDLFRGGACRLVVKPALEYLSSSGVAVLIGAFEHAQEEGGGLVLLKPSACVREVLSLLGFTDAFEVVEDLPGALQAWGGGPS